MATTANITVATALNAGDTIDGVVLTAGDRVLVKDQTSQLQNGIYEAGTTPARTIDFDESAEVLGALIYVIAGTANAASLWTNTNTATIVVETDAITFAEFSPSGNFELNIEGGQSVISAHGAMGATETFDPTAGNVHTGTLDANCVFTISAPVGSGASTLTFWITASGTRTWTWPGSVTWLAGTAPDPPADGLTTVVVLTSVDGGTNWVGGPWGAGSESPLTTKGDLWGFSTLDARVPVGANLTVLTGDSTATLGVSYKTLETLGHWEPLMDGGSPYAPLDDGTGADWLFVFVPG